jgi:hypothetical protein
MPVVVDSRGITVYISDDEARAEARDLIERGEQALNIAEARGWSLSDSDAEQVRSQLEEAERLLRDLGEYKSVGPSDLSRFYSAPPTTESEFQRSPTTLDPDTARRVAELVRMVEQLGADDDDDDSDESVVNSTGSLVNSAGSAVNSAAGDVNSAGESTSQPLESTSQPERPSVKRHVDTHGLVWWDVSGRGPNKRFATLDHAEREARARINQK